MRALLAILALAATLRAHPEWKQANADVTAEGDRLRVTLRMDIPSYLVGRTPQAAEVRELDALMLGEPAALGHALAEAPARLRRDLAAEVDGVSLEDGPPVFPSADAVRSQMGGQPEAHRYPVMLCAVADFRLPGGEGDLRLRFPPELGSVRVTFRTSPGRIDMLVVPAGEWSDPVPVSGTTRGFLATFTGFVASGFGHVLPGGWDHALFMLAMFLGTPSLGSSIRRSLSFTAGHCATLALVWLGWIAAPGGWIEPLIAGSIILAGTLAARDVATVRRVSGGSAAFGLLHGLGFAASTGPEPAGSPELAGALAGFNTGVELAQLLIIAGASALILPWRGRGWFERRLRRPLAWMTAGGGAWLLVEQL